MTLYPSMVNIEQTNACNAKCPMCPATTTARVKGLMSDETFARILAELTQWPVRPKVFMHGIGEPLLHKRAWVRVGMLEALGFRVTLVTNVALLDETAAERLLDAGLSVLNASIDTLDRDLYQHIRVGLKYVKVISNLIRFIVMRNERNAATRVMLTAVRSDENHGGVSLADCVALGMREGDSLQLVREHAFGAHMAREAGNEPCRQVFDALNISFSGRVALCCVDSEMTEPMGDGMPYLDIFNGPAFRRIRGLHEAGRRREIATCAQCDYPTSMAQRETQRVAA